MTRIKVKLIGYLFSLAHKREIIVETEDPAVLRTVIEKAIQTVGGRLKEYLVDPKTGKLWTPTPLVRVNDEPVSASYDSVTLHEGDTVSLRSAISG